MSLSLSESHDLLNSSLSATLQNCRRKRTITKSDSDLDNDHTTLIVNNKLVRNSDLSQISSSSDSLLSSVGEHTSFISPEILCYANSMLFSPITITNAPHFTPLSSLKIVTVLRYLEFVMHHGDCKININY